MSATSELRDIVQKLDSLCSENGARAKAKAIHESWLRRANSVNISAKNDYGHRSSEPEDEAAANYFKAELVKRYDEHGRKEATAALDRYRREILRLRMALPLAVAAAHAEAFQMAQDLAEEVALRKKES